MRSAGLRLAKLKVGVRLQLEGVIIFIMILIALIDLVGGLLQS